MEPDMQDENPNDFHWKNKLEDAESLSGETLTDNNAAWEKLHARLSEKPRRIRAAWYWSAAACLLLAVIIPMMTATKKQPGLVKNNTEQTQPKKSTATKAETQKENEVVKVTPVETAKKNTIKAPEQTSEKKDAAIDIAQQEATVSTGFNDQQTIVPPPIILPQPPADTAPITILAMLPAKRKLKIVHINELGDVVEVPLNIACNTDYHTFQFGLIGQQVYTSASINANNTGFNIFKTSNSPTK